MHKKCTICGRSESQVTADAKALGLVQELECGIYSCCQISEWADEQSLAWAKAAHEDAIYTEEQDSPRSLDAAEPTLVTVRVRRRQVPWYRNPEELT
jgi:hypothetical protein